jgi:Zn-finger nucleic acid-binding protein
METVKEPDITVDRCAACGGIFLDKNELNVLATGMSGDIEYCSIDKDTHADTHKPRQ